MTLTERRKLWILVDAKPEPVDSLEEWGRWFQSADRTVAFVQTPNEKVSTVFLGIDHNFDFNPGHHTPLLYETMVFGGPLEGEQDRYATLEEAKAGHEIMVAKVKAAHGTF